MEFYYVNKNQDSNGNNEVHAQGCSRMPSASNRECLGYFNNGKEAVKEAKTKGYSKADGCFYCCREAHTA